MCSPRPGLSSWGTGQRTDIAGKPFLRRAPLWFRTCGLWPLPVWQSSDSVSGPMPFVLSEFPATGGSTPATKIIKGQRVSRVQGKQWPPISQFPSTAFRPGSCHGRTACRGQRGADSEIAGQDRAFDRSKHGPPTQTRIVIVSSRGCPPNTRGSGACPSQCRVSG